MTECPVCHKMTAEKSGEILICYAKTCMAHTKNPSKSPQSLNDRLTALEKRVERLEHRR